MTKGRLEAFSDGVLAIIITVMVLELKVPKSGELGGLIELLPTLLAYLISFIYVGIYWNNHHHLFQIVKRVNGATLWANLHLLFWLSLVPFVTAWAGETHFPLWPVVCYGLVLMGAGAAYRILVLTLIAQHGRESLLARAIGNDFKGKISVIVYLVAIAFAFWQPCVSCALYVLVAIIWFFPDSRIERTLQDHPSENQD